MQDEAAANSLRPILPRTARQQSPQPAPAEKRIKRVTAACELCRQRRVKCDATRPSCTPCSVLDEKCVYRTTPYETSVGALKRKFGELEAHYDRLKASQEQLQRLLHAIRTRPDGDAVAIFESIRSGNDVESIVRHICNGDLTSQLRMVPESKYRFDLPFKSEMPGFLQTPDNLYLQSPLHEAALAFPGSEQQAATMSSGVQQNPQYLKPYFTASLVDPRLERVEPSKWTRVSEDDRFMRSLLRFYFFYEHQWMGCFHKDDFLDDMLSGSEEHCTPLLVNAVLAIACHSYELPNRADYWDPHTLGYKFFAEAKRLWEFESKSQKSLPTVQAALIFNILFNLDCVDMIGNFYKDQAITIAHELDLFNTTTHSTSKSGRNSRAFTMWSLFWFSSLQDYHIHNYTEMKDFPAVGLPNPDMNPEWYGESWLQYSQDAQTYPVGYGHLFKAKCELSVIMHSICAHLYGRNQRATEQQIEIAQSHIDALLAWYTSLPNILLPEHLVFPAQLHLHMLYQDTKIRLCEILLTVPPQPMANPPKTDPESLMAHSKVCLETLLRLYYLRHGFEGSDGYLIHFLHVLAYIARNQLMAISDAPSSFSRDDVDNARATLFLAAKGLYLQSKSYYIAVPLFCVLQDDMRLEEANMLYKYAGIIRDKSAFKRLKVEYVKAADYPRWIAKAKDGEARKPGLTDAVGSLSLAVLNLDSDSEDSGGLRMDSR